MPFLCPKSIGHRYSWNKCFIIYQTNEVMQKYCSMSQYFTGNKTRNASFAVKYDFSKLADTGGSTEISLYDF